MSDAFKNLYLVFFLTLIFVFFSLLVLLYIRNAILTRKINRYKIFGILFDVFVGGGLACYFLFNFYFYNFFNGGDTYTLINLIAFICVCFALFHYISAYCGTSFCIVLVIIWACKFEQFDHDTIFQILFSIILFCVFGIGFSYFKNSVVKSLCPLISLLGLTIIFTAYPTARESWYYYYLVINLCLFSYLYMLSVKYIISFFNQTIKIKENVVFENKYYVNGAYSKDAFYEFIDKNNISFGYFIMIDINEDDESKMCLLPEFFNTRFKDSEILYFKNLNKKFFVFIPKITNDHDEMWLKSNLARIEPNFINAKLKFNYLITIYGIHSNSYEELMDNCKSLTELNQDYKVIIYKSKDDSNYEQEKIIISSLIKQIPFSNHDKFSIK